MKAFNLDDAKAGKLLTTGAGNQARFLMHVPEAASVMVLIGGNQVVSYREDGTVRADPSLTLYMAPEKFTRFANVYAHPLSKTVRLSALAYSNQVECDAAANTELMGKLFDGYQHIRTITVEVEL